MNLRALSLCAAAAVAGAVTAAADDRVLVLSAPAQLLHASSSSASSSPSAFSSAGLAELAMDALGLGSGGHRAQAAQSPVQADVFRRARAYALVVLQDDGALLEAVEAAAAFPPTAFHALFPLAARPGAAQRAPDAIAGELLAASAGSVQCAGSKALCAGKNLRAAEPPADALVQRVLAANHFLHKDVLEDAAFARELAQVQQLTAQLRHSDAETALYIVGFSDVQTLDSSKRRDARTALVAQVGEFLSALQKTHEAAGAQVVAARAGEPSPTQLKTLTRLDDVTSYARLLAALAPEPSGSADDDDDDESDESDDSGSGDAGVEVGATNATRGSNATSAEKVTLEQIAEYQIVLWTSVLLATTLLLVVLTMCNMNTGRDSLLYAKFITDAGHRKND